MTDIIQTREKLNQLIAANCADSFVQTYAEEAYKLSPTEKEVILVMASNKIDHLYSCQLCAKEKIAEQKRVIFTKSFLQDLKLILRTFAVTFVLLFDVGIICLVLYLYLCKYLFMIVNTF